MTHLPPLCPTGQWTQTSNPLRLLSSVGRSETCCEPPTASVFAASAAGLLRAGGVNQRSASPKRAWFTVADLDLAQVLFVRLSPTSHPLCSPVCPLAGTQSVWGLCESNFSRYYSSSPRKWWLMLTKWAKRKSLTSANKCVCCLGTRLEDKGRLVTIA